MHRYGSLINVACSIGEMVHKLFKQLVPHTNYLDIDKSFCLYWTLLDSLRLIIDCRKSHAWYDTLVQLRKENPGLMSGYFFGQIARFSEENEWFTNQSGAAFGMEFMKEERFPDLIFGAKIPHSIAKEYGPLAQSDPAELTSHTGNTPCFFQATIAPTRSSHVRLPWSYQLTSTDLSA